MMNDLISRQAAIDAIDRLDIPEDMCVFEILSHIELEIGNLPSAQPEIIRCKDCKWHEGRYHCLNFDVVGFDYNDYCSLAARKEQDDG